jgi:aminopeptidase N
MKWWGDLWLNESFANFIACLCLEEAPGLEKFTHAWGILQSETFRGIKADQLETTHPISCKVIHAQAALDNFDAISYDKGALFIKQIYNQLG